LIGTNLKGGNTMELRLNQKFKLLISKKTLKIIIAFFIIIISIIILYLKFWVNNQDNVTSTLRTGFVTKGNITTSVTGSGPIESSKRISLLSPGNTSVTQMNFKEGDKIKKGDLVYTLDDTSLQQDILKINSDILQAQTTRNSDLKSISQLDIKAPFSGTVTGITINTGDSLQKGASIFTITDTSKLKLTVAFNEDEINKISVGNGAAVYVQNLMQSVDGVVSYVSNSPYTTSNGGKIYDVEISIENPGALTDGVDASAEIYTSSGSQASVDNGKLTYARKMSIQPQATGTVDSINVRENQKVNSGDTLVILKNDDLSQTLESDNNKIKLLQEQLKCDNEQFKNYKVTSPIDGSVVSQTFKQGDNVKSGDEISIVADTTNMEFVVSVDELDIAKISEGQDVNVSIDAISQTSMIPLSGTVKKIAPEGTSTNGVTTYNVTISINANKRNTTGFGNGFNLNGSGTGSNSRSNWRMSRSNGNNSSTNGNSGSKNKSSNMGNSNSGWNFGSRSNGSSRTNGSGRTGRTGSLKASTIRAGMNANAQILISSKKNVLTVPLEAIHRVNGQSYVMVKSDAKTVAKLKKQGKYVDIFSMKRTFSSNQPGNRSGNSGNKNSSSKSNSGSRGGNNKNSNNSNRNSNSSSSDSSSTQNQEYYANSVPTKVVTGANDENNIEIVSGIKQGKEVLLPPITLGQTNSSSSKTSSQGNSQWSGGQSNALRSGGSSLSGGGYSGGGRN
jgi:HlyD family secretion protein